MLSDLVIFKTLSWSPMSRKAEGDQVWNTGKGLADAGLGILIVESVVRWWWRVLTPIWLHAIYCLLGVLLHATFWISVFQSTKHEDWVSMWPCPLWCVRHQCGLPGTAFQRSFGGTEMLPKGLCTSWNPRSHDLGSIGDKFRNTATLK